MSATLAAISDNWRALDRIATGSDGSQYTVTSPRPEGPDPAGVGGVGSELGQLSVPNSLGREPATHLGYEACSCGVVLFRELACRKGFFVLK